MCMCVCFLIVAKQVINSEKNKNTVKTQCTVKTSQRNTKYYNSKTTDTVLAGLVLAETVRYEGLIILSPVRMPRGLHH